MRLTVLEALQIYPLSHAKLIAGERGGSRVLRSVTLMDDPDIAQWVKSDEILFTTGFMLKDSPDQAVSLLRKLDERGAAGLGVKIGRFWDRIPEELIEEANRLNFPILELPYEFTFSDQMTALFNSELAERTKLLHGVFDKQRQLMQFALRQNDLSNLFHIISGILGHPIAVIAVGGHILYNNGPIPEQRLLLNWPWSIKAYWEGGKKERAYRIPLLHDNTCVGYLKVCTSHSLVFKEEEALFQQASEILAYHLGMDTQGISYQSSRFRVESLLQDVIQNKITIDGFINKCVEYGIKRFAKPYQCVFTILDRNHVNVMEPVLMRELAKSSVLKSFDVEHFRLEEGILSVFSLSDQVAKDSLGLTKAISENLTLCQKIVPLVPLQSYVSQIKFSIGELLVAYGECIETYKMAKRMKIDQPVLFYETVEFNSIFKYLPEEVMNGYCHHILSPLLIDNKEWDEELIQTLEVYLQCDGSMSETSRQLFIHRNTVAYRLEKINDVLKVDLKNMNHLLRLKLAFMFRSFLVSSK